MSCSGCKVLRKGCSTNCIFRSSLQWIADPDAQANAILFLVKSYGRLGLFNLIASAPQPLRPEVLKSLLHDACGRVIDPVLGAVGLMCSGEWGSCEAAVVAVLRGDPIIHNIPNISGSFSTHETQPLLVNYFEQSQTLNLEAGSSSSSNNNHNNEVMLDLSLGCGFDN